MNYEGLITKYLMKGLSKEPGAWEKGEFFRRKIKLCLAKHSVSAQMYKCSTSD